MPIGSSTRTQDNFFFDLIVSFADHFRLRALTGTAADFGFFFAVEYSSVAGLPSPRLKLVRRTQLRGLPFLVLPFALALGLPVNFGATVSTVHWTLTD